MHLLAVQSSGFQDQHHREPRGAQVHERQSVEPELCRLYQRSVQQSVDLPKHKRMHLPCGIPLGAEPPLRRNSLGVWLDWISGQARYPMRADRRQRVVLRLSPRLALEGPLAGKTPEEYARSPQAKSQAPTRTLHGLGPDDDPVETSNADFENVLCHCPLTRPVDLPQKSPVAFRVPVTSWLEPLRWGGELRSHIAR